MRIPLNWKLIIPALIVLHACSSNSEETQELSIAEITELFVILNDEQTETANLKTGLLEQQKVEIWSEATGIVDLPPGEISSIFPRHEGYITNVKALAGNKVHEGSVLGHYEHPHLLDMQLEYLKAKEQLMYLDSVLHREQILGKEKAVPLKNVQATLTERNKARLETATMSEKLKMFGIDPDAISAEHLVSALPLKSPISGFIESVKIHPGMYITPETLCFKIFGNKHQHVELTVFREQLEHMKKGQRVLFSLSGSDMEYEGEIFLVNRAIDPQSTTANVHVHFDDENIHLTTGSRVNARISVFQDSLYTLPKDEVIRIGNKYRIFNMKHGEYHPVWITVGREGTDWIEITGPDSIFNNQIVLQGNYYLQGSL